MNMLILIAILCIGAHATYMQDPKITVEKTIELVKAAVDSNDIATLRLLIDFRDVETDKVIKGVARRLVESEIQSVTLLSNNYRVVLIDSTKKKYEIELIPNDKSPSMLKINLYPSKKPSTPRF